MIKAKAIKNFTLKRFNEITNLKRAVGQEEVGKLFIGDTFECSNELGDYLAGGNAKNITVIEVLEVIPDEPKISKVVEAYKEVIEREKTYEAKVTDADKVEVYPTKKTTKKRNTKNIK